MISKLCTVCKHLKPFESFNKRSARKDGLQTICRDCSRSRSRAYYKKNPAAHQKAVRQRNKHAIEKHRERRDRFLKEHPCVDCGETDPIVLDFDHVQGTKIMDVSRLISRACSWKRIEAEMRKCEVRCANCHRRQTHIRRMNQAKHKP